MIVNYYHYNALCVNDLFSDAKSWEYGLKYVGGGDGARDGAEMRDAFAEVLGHEVAG